ncbi:uncharacterized protein LOC130047531 [Ostrea edulis]|uniref:uncharacterized protein LOC130047531 n=1 Tax=Ostrea edulis TaxID=37623 RepID=UPI0024AF6F74|nr:uncharacterized protein LOC130047531 [Ostrea edulis]
MAKHAVINILQLLRQDSKTHPNERKILERLTKVDPGDVATELFTKAAECMRTPREIVFKIIQSLISFAVDLLQVPLLKNVAHVLAFIGKILLFITEHRDSYSIVSEKVHLRMLKKMEHIDEKFHAFCSCFDARSDELITSHKSRNLTVTQAKRLSDNLKYKEIGMGFSGELEAIIIRYKDSLDERNLKLVGEFLKVYARVAIMRCLMQVLIFSITRDKKIKSTTQQMKMYIEGDISRRVDFLTQILEPCHENAIFLSSFNIAEFSELDIFLKGDRNTTVQSCLREISDYLTAKCIALQSVVFPGHWMNLASTGVVWSTGYAPHNKYAQFCFETVSMKYNVFFIKSFQWQTSYLYMKSGNSFLSSKTTRPSEEGMFKVLLLPNGNCLLSVVKYPGRFVIMKNNILGRIKGEVTGKTYYKGKPNVQHEWSMKEMCHIKTGNDIIILESPRIANVFS